MDNPLKVRIPVLAQEETKNLGSPIFVKEVESIFKNTSGW